MNRSVVAAACILGVICMIPACAEQIPSEEAIRRALSAASAQLPGLSLREQPRRLDLAGLKDAHPDMGSVIAQYPFCWALQASFATDSGEKPIGVTVVRMQTAVDAFGPFGLQRSDEVTAVALPTAAYWLGDHLHVWRGEHYVRASAPAEDPEARPRAVALVTRVMSDIPVPDTLPTLLRVLPWKVRHVGQPVYRRGGVLGVSLPHDGVTCEYLEGDETCMLAVLRSDTPAGAGDLYEELLVALAGSDDAVAVLPEAGDVAVSFTSEAYGDCVMMREENFVAAVLGYHDSEFGQELLRATGTEIRTYILAAG
jgi:hypothetical protein